MSSRRPEEMDRLFDQMERIFAQMRDRLAQSDIGTNVLDMRWNRGMAVDVYDDEDAMMIVADLPGFDREDIDLTIRGSVLDIRAEHEAEDEHVHRRRSIRERVTIPTEIDAEDINASYHNGVLEICLPYTAASEAAHRIEIE